MICCLNPGCTLENPPCPDAVQHCTSCGTKLVLLSDRYCPVSRIGEGGFGVTYLAQDRQRFNKDCVIKQLIVHNSKAKELFEQEAKQLEHLGSQCSQIPRLLAYPSDKQYLYLVQEFIAGQNLEKYLADNGVQNEEQIKDFLNTLLPVLELIHKNQIIHRDIKLDNIMRRDDGQLVLIDFGVAKQLIGNNTPVPGTIAGTPGYAPSEQMIQGIAYPSSDLYSLGAACFHLLTGKHPYKAYEVHDFKWTYKWRQYLQQPISNELGKILDKMLQEKYQDRYRSARDVIRALQDLQPPVPVPNQTVPVNPSVHLTHKTAWLNFYTALIGGFVVLAGGAFTIVNQQQKTPSLPTSKTNSTASTETDDKNAQKLIDQNDKTQQQQTPISTTSPSNNSATAETYYQRGRELAGKDNKGAIEAFTKAIELNYVYAYNDRGNAKSDLGDKKGAIEDYTQLIKLKPDSSDVYIYRGIVKSDLGDKKGAIEDYNQAIKFNPDSWYTYYNLGNAKSKLGDYQSAIEGYNQSIKLESDYSNAYINRGYAKSNLGNQKGAIEDYTQAIKLKPDYSDAYYARGIAKSSLSDKKGAIEDYNQAAKLYQKQGKTKDSQNALEQVKKLSK
jgi:serine/threonine protein kinase